MTKREIILLSLVLVVAGGGLYFMFFFTPTMERIAELEMQIPELQLDVSDAGTRQLQYEGATARLLEVEERWYEEYAESIPPSFDDTDILRRIQRLIYPRTHVLTIDFEQYNVELGANMFITSVPIEFETTYPLLMEILNLLTEEGIDNRVVSYTMTRDNNFETVWEVSMLLEFLTMSDTGTVIRPPTVEEETEEVAAIDVTVTVLD